MFILLIYSFYINIIIISTHIGVLIIILAVPQLLNKIIDLYELLSIKSDEVK